MEWVAPATGAMTLITSASFSNVANTGTTFDNIFSGYTSNIVVITTMEPNTTADDLQVQFLASGTAQITDYFSASLNYAENGTTPSSITSASQTLFTINKAGAMKGFLTIVARQQFSGFGYNGNDGEFMIYNGFKSESSTLTGIRFKSATSNITGTVAIYGLKV